jgi:hypothetical protein
MTHAPASNPPGGMGAHARLGGGGGGAWGRDLRAPPKRMSPKESVHQWEPNGMDGGMRGLSPSAVKRALERRVFDSVGDFPFRDASVDLRAEDPEDPLGASRGDIRSHHEAVFLSFRDLPKVCRREAHPDCGPGGGHGGILCSEDLRTDPAALFGERLKGISWPSHRSRVSTRSWITSDSVENPPIAIATAPRRGSFRGNIPSGMVVRKGTA